MDLVEQFINLCLAICALFGAVFVVIGVFEMIKALSK